MARLHPEAERLLDEMIARHGLEHAAGLIRESAEPCYAVVSDGPDDYTVAGRSRLGGVPDLPAEAAWPTPVAAWGEPSPCAAVFFAQINFADLPPLGSPSPLPAGGIMHLFVHHVESAGEPVPLTASLCPEGTALGRREPPAGIPICDEYLEGLTAVRVRFVPWVSLPHNDPVFRKRVEQEGGEVDGSDAISRCVEMNEDLRLAGQIGQLLGYANTGDERENLCRQVQLTRMGRREMVYADYWDSMEAYERTLEESEGTPFLEEQAKMRPHVEWLVAHKDEVASGAAEWRLLLQIESNEDMNLLINDYDPLYVFVRDADLRREDFSDLAGEVTQG